MADVGCGHADAGRGVTSKPRNGNQILLVQFCFGSLPKFVHPTDACVQLRVFRDRTLGEALDERAGEQGREKEGGLGTQGTGCWWIHSCYAALRGNTRSELICYPFFVCGCGPCAREESGPDLGHAAGHALLVVLPLVLQLVTAVYGGDQLTTLLLLSLVPFIQVVNAARRM